MAHMDRFDKLDGELFYTLREAAEQLRVSRSWLRRSNCPRVRLSARIVRYPKRELLGWLTDRLAPPGSSIAPEQPRE